MSAKEFILDKIENDWTMDFADTNADNINELAKAFEEYANYKNNSLALDELGKLISKYDKSHSHVGIVTCDTNDVWNWISEVEEKLGIE